MTLSEISLSHDELARAAPIIAHVGSAMGVKSSVSELRGGTVRMLDEVCRGAGIPPVEVRTKSDLDREFTKLEHALFRARRTAERFTVEGQVDEALRQDADAEDDYVFPFRAAGLAAAVAADGSLAPIRLWGWAISNYVVKPLAGSMATYTGPGEPLIGELDVGRREAQPTRPAEQREDGRGAEQRDDHRRTRRAARRA